MTFISSSSWYGSTDLLPWYNGGGERRSLITNSVMCYTKTSISADENKVRRWGFVFKYCINQNQMVLFKSLTGSSKHFFYSSSPWHQVLAHAAKPSPSLRLSRLDCAALSAFARMRDAAAPSASQCSLRGASVPKQDVSPSCLSSSSWEIISLLGGSGLALFGCSEIASWYRVSSLLRPLRSRVVQFGSEAPCLKIIFLGWRFLELYIY